jgi:hypothetical protein
MIENIGVSGPSPSRLRYLMKRFVRILSALLILIVGVAHSHQCLAGQPVSFSTDIQAEAQRGGYRLLDLNGLWELYRQAGNIPMLIDTRQDWEYQAGHIKDAVNFPMEPTWLARFTQRGALEQFLGPDKTRTIVFY